MKFAKFLILLTALTLIIGLVSCGKEEDKDTSSQTSSSQTSSAAESSENESSADESSQSNNSSADESSEVSSSPGSQLDGDLEDILAAIYAAVDDVEELKDFNPEYLATTEIDPDDCFYYFGVNSLDFEEAIASEFEMGGGYSLCLVRAKSLDDVDEIKEAITENVDPWKWVCMGVDEDKVVVDSIGDVIILIMYEHSEPLHEIFLDLA